MRVCGETGNVVPTGSDSLGLLSASPQSRTPNERSMKWPLLIGTASPTAS
jgi:hypothetical protein